MSGNYDKLYAQSRERFLTFPQQEMIEHFRLEHDEKTLYFHILGRDAALERATGRIFLSGREAGFNEACSVYDILSRAAEKPVLSGNWVGIAELGGNTAIYHSEKLLSDLGGLIAGLDRAKEACRRWGGQERAQGDLSFIVPLFDFFPVWIQVWEGEEELGIPDRFNCLWDANTLDFMFYETTWYARGYLLSRLLKEAEG